MASEVQKLKSNWFPMSNFCVAATMCRDFNSQLILHMLDVDKSDVLVMCDKMEYSNHKIEKRCK